MAMDSEEYFKGEPHDDDDEEITVEYLIDEIPDLDFLMLPKINIDVNVEIEYYYKLLKKCRNKMQMINILNQFYLYIDTMVTLRNDIEDLQDKAKALELNVQMLGQMR